MASLKCDVAVIGGGIAGVSAAYYLADSHSVILLEAEAQLAFHSTGRSAALYVENYGANAVRPLTRASLAFFTNPPDGLADFELTIPRGVLWIGTKGRESALSRILSEALEIGSPAIELRPSQAMEKVPVLVEEQMVGAVWEPGPFDLDVAGIHQAYVRGLRERGGDIRVSSPVRQLRFANSRWTISAGELTVSARHVVNAAGAWGDEVAKMAGIQPVGLEPRRRTAFMVAGSEEWADWPFVMSADHDFYFKPDGSQLLCSPADETPTEPSDAKPDQVDVALAIERINTVTTLAIRSVRSEWAGLRTFAPDESMVIGPDPASPAFVWAVGQGGTGIQTAPAAGQLVAAHVRGEPPPANLARANVDPEALGPTRLRRHGD